MVAGDWMTLAAFVKMLALSTQNREPAGILWTL